MNGENASPKLNSQPAVNVKETNQSFDLELAAPGLGKGDFNIEVNNDVLSISFEKKTENEVKEESYNVREFGYQSFKRSFTLPETVNADKIQAKYEQGVLSLTIPKKPENQPQPIKTIKIS
ncbi:MAG: Hsp20/alpha crystallin family protein [Bacteroidetes bacterium]|nr:Hsp20/alpha crystallin family protein [Bacteroidota bacterium]